MMSSGIIFWKNSPNGKILETDVVIAKNRAKRHIPMTMEDWFKRIDKYLLSDDLDVLKDAGKISHKMACDKALSEFQKYRFIQDKIFESDFDKFMLETANENN